MWAPQIRAGDVVNGPYATASTAPIVDRDISAVAAEALLTDELVGRKIPLTGPQAFTNAELVQIIGTVLGRPLRYQEVPAELVRERFLGLGFSAEFADAYIAFLEATVSKPALVTHEVEKILGRPAETFAESRRRPSRAVHQSVRETSHVGSTPAAVPQADEQVHDGRPEARHPDRARRWS